MSITPRYRGPALFVRERDGIIETTYYGSTGLQTPSSGTFVLYDADENTISSGAVSVATDSTVSFTILAASLPSTLALSATWRIDYVLVFNAKTYYFSQDAQLVRRVWVPSVTGLDLVATSPVLANYYDLSTPADNQKLWPVIQAATEDVQSALVAQGRRPWLIFDGWRLNAYLIQVILERIYRSAAADRDSAEAATLLAVAETHRNEAKTLWAEGSSFKYDVAESGKPKDQANVSHGRVRIGPSR